MKKYLLVLIIAVFMCGMTHGHQMYEHNNRSIECTLKKFQVMKNPQTNGLKIMIHNQSHLYLHQICVGQAAIL